MRSPAIETLTHMAAHPTAPVRASVIERSHLSGIVGSEFVGVTRLPPPQAVEPPAELQRDLVEYEALLGGGW